MEAVIERPPRHSLPQPACARSAPAIEKIEAATEAAIEAAIEKPLSEWMEADTQAAIEARPLEKPEHREAAIEKPPSG